MPETNNQNTTSFDGKSPKRSVTSSCTLAKIGVDYFGPFMVKHLRKQEKHHRCNEKIHSKTWNTTDIYSDNGTNFVRADRELKQSQEVWNQSQIAYCLPQKDIQFRLVMQESARRVLHGQVDTDEVLETAFAEAEALVNSRPLTEVSSDSGLEAITKNHFLISCANPVLPCGVFTDVWKYQARNVGDKHNLLLIKFGADG